MNKQIAKELLSIGAVFLRPDEPFTWASGIKSPIYCDNRLTLSEPTVRVPNVNFTLTKFWNTIFVIHTFTRSARA